MSSAAVSKLSRFAGLVWVIDTIDPDTTVHRNVEIREVGLDPRGAHLTHVRMLPDSQIVGTVHETEHEFVLVLRGAVTADIDGVLVPGAPGSVFNIPAGVTHGYIPVDPDEVVELLAIYAPRDDS